MKRVGQLLLLLALAAGPSSRIGHAQMFPQQFKSVGIDQRVGAMLPLDTVFRDENGTSVSLGTYFGQKPVLLLPMYYTCTTLCTQALSGLIEGISPLSMHAGRDFEVVAFSINPEEKPADALKKRSQSGMNYAGNPKAPGWHFLTGSPAAIRTLTNAIGFHYQYDPVNHMYVHASALLVVSPQGRISRYLYGVTYEPKALQQGLLSAAHEQTSVTANVVRLLCYPFSPHNGRYGELAMILLRCAAGATLLLLTGGLILLWRIDLRRHRNDAVPGASL